MEENQEKKKKKKGLIIILIIAALLGTALTLLFLNLKKKPVETVEEPTEWQYFWNVDRGLYAGKSDTGMSSRKVEKDDGFFHVLFAVGGRQVTRRVAEKKLINIIDANDLMGLVFDDKGIVTDMKPIDDIIDGYEVGGYYIESIGEDGKLTLRSSSSLNGQTMEYTMPAGVHIYDVSGVIGYVGQEIQLKDLLPKDRLFVIRNLDGTVTEAFVTQRYVRPSVYWNISRQYNSELKATTREPNALGEYEILLAVDGEQRLVKTKNRNLVSSIDSYAAKCFGLEFDENGYISRVKGAAQTTGGAVFGSWAHVISIVDKAIHAEKLIAATDQGKLWDGELADDVRVFDVSGAGEFVGQEVFDLGPGDQIHALTDANGKVSVVFIVGRLSNSPVYWNTKRMYDSTKKETTRKPNANGLYEFVLAAEGKQYTFYVDKKTANTIDSYPARCFGLKLDGDQIKEVIAANNCKGTGGGVSSSWHDVISMSDSLHFHTRKTTSGSSDYGAEADVVMTKDTLVINGSTNFVNFCGEKTTLQVGDRVHVLLNLKHEAAVVFVVDRPIDVPLYWNVSRKYDSTKKETSRKPDENGYYVFEMLVNGGTQIVRTKDKELATAIDNQAVRLVGLQLNGDVITNVYASTSTVKTKGGSIASWADVTKVNSPTSFHTLKDPKASDSHAGEELDLKTTGSTKIYNVSGVYENHPGEETTVRVGDRVHCLKDKDGNISYVFIVGRTVPDVEKYCPICDATVTWTSFTGVVPKPTDGKPVHQYMYGDRTHTNWAGFPANGEVHLDMNGKTLTGPDDIRCLYQSSSGSTVRIFDLSGTGKGTITGGTGRKQSDSANYAALMGMAYSNGKLYLKDITIDASTVNQDGVIGSIYVPTNATLSLENVTVKGGRLDDGAAIYCKGNLILKNSTIQGGTVKEGGIVTITETGSVTIDGTTVISGGKRTDGTDANLYLEKGAKVATEAGLTGSKIGVRLSESGIFAPATVGEQYAGAFISDIPSSPVTKRADNRLEINYVITGISFPSSTMKLQVGVPTTAEVSMNPANDPNLEIIYESSDPAAVTVLPDGSLLANKATTAPVTITAKTKDGKMTATMTVTGEGSTEGAHYHAEDTNAAIHAGTGTKIVYTAWESETALPTASGYYYLTKDVKLAAKQPLQPENTDIHLCLNGHKVLQETEDNIQAYSLFYEGSTFALLDCSDGETGSFQSVGTYNQPGRTIWVRYGTFNFYGGTIVGSTSTNTAGGGAISITAGAAMNMYGGTVTGGTAHQGGNIYAAGELNVYAGTIKDGTADTSKGGNIYIPSPGKAHIENAVITGGKASAGGNISIYGGSALYLKNTEITNGTVTDAGGNLQILSGKVDIINTTISGGKAGSASKTDMHINGQKAYTATNVTIQDSTIDKGILLQQSDSTVLTGKVLIGTEANKTGIYLGNTSFTPNLSAKVLAADSKIYITEDVAGLLVKDAAAYKFCFVQTKAADLAILIKGNDLYLGSSHNHCVCGGEYDGVGSHVCKDVTIPENGWTAVSSEADITALQGVGEDLKSGTAEYFIYLAKDITLTNSINTYTNVTLNICLNGHTLLGAKDKRVMMTYYAKPGTIRICDCSKDETGVIQCQGGIGSDSSTLQGHAVLLYNAGSKLELYSGTIRDGYAKNNFGGNIAVSANTTFNMYGGKVLNGKSEKITTGKSVGNSRGGNIGGSGANAVINIYGGVVSGGEARFGGNIYGDAELNIYGGTIAGGKATRVGTEGGFGGNIATNGKVNISGGEILNGIADGNVGGNIALHNANGRLVMTGGTVKGGKALTNAQAGGIAIFYQATAADVAKISGGTITENEGGVYIATGGLKLSGNPTIDGNTNGNLTASTGTMVALGGALTGGKISFNAKQTDEILPSDTDYSAYLKNDNDTFKCVYDAGKKVHVFTVALVPHDDTITHCICGGSHNGEAGHTCEPATWTKWGATSAEKQSLPATAGNFYLVEDIDLGNSEITLDKDVVICLNGHTITGEKQVMVTGKLTFCDCQTKIVNSVKYQGKTVLKVTEPTEDTLFTEEGSGIITTYDGEHTNTDAEKVVDLLNDPDNANRKLDIYILAGQSNAIGSTILSSAKEGEHDYNEYKNVHYYAKIIGTDGSVKLNDTAFGPVKEGQGFDTNHIGPELGMAQILNEKYTSTDYQAVLFKYAAGGTSILMHQDDAGNLIGTYSDDTTTRFNTSGSWYPTALQTEALKALGANRPSGYLTRGLIESLGECYETLLDAGYKAENINFVTISWMQGETDRANPASYKTTFPLVMDEIRTGISEATGKNLKNLPIVIGEISESFDSAAEKTVANNRSFIAMQNGLVASVPALSVIPTGTLQMNVLVGGESTIVGTDTWHWNYKDILTVGNLFADAALNPAPVHEHCACGGTLEEKTVPGTTHTCEKNVYLPWGATNDLPRYDDLKVGENFFYLTQDVTMSTNWQISKSVSAGKCLTDMGGRKLVLCLNGHTIQSNTGILLNSLATTGPNTYAANIDVTMTDCTGKGGVKLRKDYAAGATRGGFARLAGTNDVLTIYAGTYDCNGTNVTTNGTLMSIEASSTLNVYGGSFVGGKSTVSGGQITVCGTATMNIYGGDFSGGECASANTSTAPSYGGNLYVYGKGVVNMYGGTIRNGKNNCQGGNVGINENAVFNMSGGEIKDGTTTGSTCGNVYTLGNAVFNMKGGTISGGSAPTYGGNVVPGGKSVFNLYDGKIINGKLTGTSTWRVGANVYHYDPNGGSTFNMSGGEISGGTGATNGGNVEVEKGVFNMKGGVIKGGTATNKGGNVLVNENGTFNLSGGEISGGYVHSNGKNYTYGGNVGIMGTFTMSGGTITKGSATENNSAAKAQGMGANIGMTKGTFTMTGGTISNANGTISGAMYVVNSTSKVTITGGEFKDNYGWCGGAIHIATSANVTIGGTAKFTNNQCGSSGYGAAISNASGVLTLKGTPVFSGNSQRTSGKLADIYVKTTGTTTTVDSTFNPTSPVRITLASGGNETVTAGAFATATTDLSMKFIASDSTFNVTYSGGKLNLVKK